MVFTSGLASATYSVPSSKSVLFLAFWSSPFSQQRATFFACDFLQLCLLQFNNIAAELISGLLSHFHLCLTKPQINSSTLIWAFSQYLSAVPFCTVCQCWLLLEVTICSFIYRLAMPRFWSAVPGVVWINCVLGKWAQFCFATYKMCKSVWVTTMLSRGMKSNWMTLCQENKRTAFWFRLVSYLRSWPVLHCWRTAESDPSWSILPVSNNKNHGLLAPDVSPQPLRLNT